MHKISQDLLGVKLQYFFPGFRIRKIFFFGQSRLLKVRLNGRTGEVLEIKGNLAYCPSLDERM